MSHQVRSAAVGLAVTFVAACSDGGNNTSLSPSLGSERLAPSLDQVVALAQSGGVVTATNGTTGNELVVFARNSDGSLGAETRYPTGGTGTGGGLGNQGGIVADGDARFIYVVNAGSNSITVFERSGATLTNRQTMGSGGIQPISLALRGQSLFVLNDGGVANVVGFRVGTSGLLSPWPGVSALLSASAPDAAQVGFSPDGSTLVVTEKATNNLVLFPLDPEGRLGTGVVQRSKGDTPFGFAFDRRGSLIVSEAFGGAPDGSALSSYRLSGASASVISGSVATTETAACWVVIAGGGRFAYTTNTASGTISGYRVGADGSLALLTPDGRTAIVGNGPIDMATTANGQFVYDLNGRDGTVSAFAVLNDGRLSSLGSVGALQRGANGLIAF